jgi:hypothetical protein
LREVWAATYASLLDRDAIAASHDRWHNADVLAGSSI